MVKSSQQFLGIFSPKIVTAGFKGLSFRAVGVFKSHARRPLLESSSQTSSRGRPTFSESVAREAAGGENMGFMKSPLGHTVIREMLPRICVAAQLSRRYTNHCMRATSVTMLKKDGFDDCLVCGLTGHKNTKSIKSYYQPSEEDRESGCCA